MSALPMLTRIEIDGFKTFRNFELDLSPFLVVIGRNAAGKSNLFDALQFLRLLVDGSLLEASQQMRGDLAELFHHHVDGTRVSRMSFAAEVLLEPVVTDAFGDTRTVSHSRLRYEVALEIRPTGRGDRPYVAAESVKLIRHGDDSWMKSRFNSQEQKSLAVHSRRPKVLLETTEEGDRTVFRLHQEGRQGNPRLLPAHMATATVLSSLTTVTEFPLLYALKRELQSWRFLHLDPTALRAASSYDDPDTLGANGAHLANTVRRVVDQTVMDERPDGVLADLAADLAAVIPEVLGVQLDEDEARRQRQVVVLTRDEAPFSARVASDGTLRAIALLTALYDPLGAGLVCFEEPENGIFPQRLAQFVAHLRNLVKRRLADRQENPRAPLTQLLLSSHSPAILGALRTGSERPGEVRDDAVFVDTWALVRPDGPKSRITRTRQISATRQPPLTAPVGTVVSPAEIDEFEVLDRLAG